MSTDLEKLREQFPFIEVFDQNLANVSAAAFGDNTPTQVETPEQSNPTQVETPRQMSGIERRSGGASDPFAFLTSGPGGGRGSVGSTARPTTLPTGSPTSSPTLSPTPAPQVPVGQGTVLQTPQVPSMESVGLNPLTTEPQFGGVAQTPSLQPQFDAGVAETQARLGAMFGEAPQTLSQLTAQDPASIAAQQASDAFAAESMAREARLEATLADRAAAREAQRGGNSSQRQYTDAQIRDLSGGDPELRRRYKAMDEQGIDPATGQPRGGGGLTPYQQAQIELQKIGLGIKMDEAELKRQGASEEDFNRMKDAAGALQNLESDLNLIRGKGEEIKDLTQRPRTEGNLARFLSFVSPTSTAAQIDRASDVLKGDAFIKGMQIIKAFGGGLGSVTEKEGDKVERAQGAIFTPGMSDNERRKAVDTYVSVREEAYSRIREAFVDEFGEPAAQRYLGDAPETGGADTIQTESGGTAKVYGVEEL